jgi:sialate O-acetylesterase
VTKRTLFLSFFFALLLNALSIAEVKVPAIFADHMVLQQDQKIPVWGWADPGETVTVEFSGQKKRGTADSNSQWMVHLDPVTASNHPQTLTIQGKNRILIEDVLIGEVWLASGQSNMEFNLSGTNTAVSEIANASSPEIRVFTVGRNCSLEEATDVEGSWKITTPENAGSFSAVAYFFAKELNKELDVPVGLIVSAWGGTNAEEWSSPEALKDVEEFKPILERWQKNKSRVEHLFKAPQQLSLVLDNVHFYSEENGQVLLLDDFEDRDLSTSLFGNWSSQSEDAKSSSLRVKENSSKQNHSLHFSGESLVGRGLSVGVQYSAGKSIDLSSFTGIRFEASGVGYLGFQSLQPDIIDWDNYSVDLIPLGSDKREITIRFDQLKQAGWGKQMPLRKDQLSGALFGLNSVEGGIPRPPSGLFNGMIKPLSPYIFRGAIWYQGEGNAGRSYQYRKLLPAMVNSWRKTWDQEFPFLIVQLPNFKKRQPRPSESGWAELREAQLMASRSLPSSGLTVTIDLGEADDVHPKDKSQVGFRLAKLALGKVYSKSLVHKGPEFVNFTREGEKIRIQMKVNGQALVSAGGRQVRGFTIAREDRQFEWAEARIEGDTILVWSDRIPDPVAVRYAWADNPDCSLYNSEGFPASPFRTDDWPGVTEGIK